MVDTLTKTGALRIKRKIEEYWASLGYTTVHAWVEPIPERPDLWQVRSNLKCGLPPSKGDASVDKPAIRG